MEKTCSRCGASFTCQNEARGCWCEDLTLSPETLALLRQQFDNCLCPTCLKSYQPEHKVPAAAYVNKTP